MLTPSIPNLGITEPVLPISCHNLLPIEIVHDKIINHEHNVEHNIDPEHDIQKFRPGSGIYSVAELPSVGKVGLVHDG